MIGTITAVVLFGQNYHAFFKIILFMQQRLYEALAQFRLRQACDPTKFMLVQRVGKLSGRLKELIMLLKK